MNRKQNWKTKLATVVLGGGLLASSGACIPDNFWITQWENTLTTVVNTVVGGVVVPAIETGLGS